MSKDKSVYVNRKTGTIHKSGVNNDRCRQGQIKEGNRLKYESAEEAKLIGYGKKLCRHCFSEE